MNFLRFVLDTNVLVAASRSRNGASCQILWLLRRRRFIGLASVPLMLAYEAVLKRPEQLAASKRTRVMTDEFLDTLSLFIEPVHLFYLWRPQTRDPVDEMVLEAALNGRADALITCSKKDFVVAQRFRLAVWTPGECLLQLNREQD